jgi:hypothetical protein
VAVLRLKVIFAPLNTRPRAVDLSFCAFIQAGIGSSFVGFAAIQCTQSARGRPPSVRGKR